MEKLQERLGKLTGGVSIIHVGGNSEIEMKEKKDRVEDALYATRAAIDEGIVPGGGVALLHARHDFEINDSIGRKIVFEACEAPLFKILTNAGYELSEAVEIGHTLLTSDYWTGYDLKTESVVNMKEAGIIDPAKVTRTALENAASVAGTVLLTECIIADDPENKEDNQAGKDLMFG
jgi:chaperonin GroEL